MLTGGAGVVGSLTGLLGASMDFRNQKQLMALQNQYNMMNATIAYNRQRELTRDAAMLEKQGKLQAGVNTAFGQNGSVQSVASSPPSPSVSIPSPTNFANSMLGASSNIVNALTSIAQTKADVDLKEQQKEQIRIDNLTRNLVNMANVGSLLASGKLNLGKAAEQEIKNQFAKRVFSAQASEAESAADSAASKAIIDNANASVQGAMNEVEYNKKVEELTNLKIQGKLTDQQFQTELKKLDVMNSEIYKNYTQGSLNVANTGLARANTGLVTSEKEGVDFDNTLKHLTMSDKLIESFEESEQSKLRTVGMRLQNMPRSISEHFTRSALFALERIKKGHGSPADYALVASQTAREYALYSNDQAKDWAKIILGAIPGSSSGSGSSVPSYIARPSSVPTYQ